MSSRPRGVRERLRQTAETAFGWAELHPDQLTAMEHLLAGRDVLAVMPTGSGKSAVYQVSALLLPGPTVVVSPLIALQKDQLTALRDSRAPDAVAVNSDHTAHEVDQAWDAVRSGDAEYLFLSPEQLANPDVVDRLAEVGPSLFVVDEAHCVSAWGHDFRPDYLRLGHVVEQLGHPRVLALTATAGGPVRKEIVERLGLRDAVEVVAGADRPNLGLEVRHIPDADDKHKAVLEWVEAASKPGLVYVATRKDAERVAAELVERGVDAAAFHAGLRVAERGRVHERFMDDRLDVVVATSAFGMGIDKADVRFVAHASVTDSLDSYYQQVGRGGRDGLPAQAVLFYRPEDLGLQRFLTARKIATDVVEQVFTQVRKPVDLEELCRRLGHSRRKTATVVNLLEQAGVADTDEHGRIRRTEDGIPVEEAVERVVAVAERQRRLCRSRLEVMRGYAEAGTCRRRYLLGYFGEHLDGPCGNCDICASGVTTEDPVEDDGEYPAGGLVEHGTWGAGTVVHRESDHLVVLFEEVGYKTLSLAVVREHDLLTLRK
jgi:ATP-dependent DNA helicase RecQ